jgi:hypothetical protein
MDQLYAFLSLFHSTEALAIFASGEPVNAVVEPSYAKVQVNNN